MRLPIQIQAIIFRKNGNNYQFLMLKRIQSKGGFWQVVTGGMEEGEERIQTLKREVEEETSITEFKRIIEDVDFFKFNIHLDGKPAEVEEYVYGVEIEFEIEPVFDHNIYLEHDEYRWCSFEEATKLLKWDTNKKSLKKLYSML